ncbi:MAG: hypothetical protein JST01_12115 [Cyanobacteria bacterium SZAS TMP-1]|nr:hypothetical protein [Cyanobacteria bacterium SZAS TMP-1]
MSRMAAKKLLFGIIATAMTPALISTPGASASDQGGRDFYRAPSTYAGKTLILPIGTAFEGRIQSTIGSRESRSGERFTIEVSAPVLANGSEVLIPSGSEVIGEVAEAIPSGAQPHDKGATRPLGILRVQLSSLKLPDGMTYPLVASFAPDGARNHRGGAGMTARKSGVAYIGSQAGFDAVNPAMQPRSARNSQGKLQVLKRQEILSDPVLGESGGQNSNAGGVVRALVRKGRDLMILRGSSITVRLDAPLKIAFGASTAKTSMDSPTPDEPVAGGTGKHFAKTRPAAGENGQNEDDGAQTQAQTGSRGGSGQTQSGGNSHGVLSTPVEQPGSSF